MTLALIDGDIVAFRAAAGVAQTFSWGDEEPSTVVGNPEGAREAALMSVQAWARLAGCKDVMVAFTGGHNFRKLVLPSYKAHRTGGKPVDYWTVVEAIQGSFPTMIIDGLEADDVLGILATTDRFIETSIVLTQDKDLRTVPGRHMNPLKERKPVLVEEHAGTHYWLTQTLTGDATDGYKGIPGCGAVKAARLLGPPQRIPVDVLWLKVLAAYRAARLTEEDALTQARVARILRRSDYDKLTKEILLWHPSAPVRLSLATACGASGKTLAASHALGPPTS